MLPFPDDFHTTNDYTSDTGRRIAFRDASMPQNSTGTPVAAEPYNQNDGFSPGQAIVVRVPGLETPEALAATDPITLDNLSRNARRLRRALAGRRRRVGHPAHSDLSVHRLGDRLLGLRTNEAESREPARDDRH